MQQSTKSFIQRQILILFKRGLSPPDIFEQVLRNSLSNEQFQSVQKVYQNTGSMVQALKHLDVIDIDNKLLTQITKLEKSTPSQFPLAAVCQGQQSELEVFQLLKARLTNGLSYALMLLSIATITFYILSHYVLTQFKEIFDSFGAHLPAVTQFALDWQDSFFPPYLFTGLLLILIIFILFQLKQTSQALSSSLLVRHLPFLKNVFDFSKSIAWLNHLKLFLNCGVSLHSAIQKIGSHPVGLSKFSPQMNNELKQAEQLGTTTDEIEYQIAHLIMQGERIATKASQGFVLTIMLMVVTFVAFVLLASYLPIFSMGSVM